MKTHGYDWIVRWGRHMGSSSGYIAEMCRRAADEGAPKDAIYKNDDDGWYTVRDITNRETRREMGLEPLLPTDPRVLRSYGGTSQGDEAGIHDISFPNVGEAVRWAERQGVAARVRLRDDQTGKRWRGEAIVVQLLPEPLGR